MRITAVSAAVALTVLTLATSLHGQRPDDQVDPRSLALLQQGKAAKAAGDLNGATDALESALVVDPRNRQAFVVLAEVARSRGLPGKAIRYYREALTLEPNDQVALRGQGEAMVAKGAVEKARENLARIRAVCASQCGEATALATVIAKGPPPQPTVAAQASAATPPTPAK